MSSLWTPGGEVPVDRTTGAASSPEPPSGAEARPAGSEQAPGNDPGAPSEEELAARAEQLTRILLGTPACDVVAQHAMGLYELAVVHLSQESPDLDAARLAIDAFAALLERLQGRLGEAEGQLQQVLPQLQMAFVQTKDRVGAPVQGSAEDTPS